MADLPISGLPVVTAPSSSYLIAVVSGSGDFTSDGVTSQMTVSQVYTAVSSSVKTAVSASTIMVLGAGGCSTVRCGVSNTASGNYSFAGAGSSNTASGNYAFVGGGRSNTASGYNNALVLGGRGNTADGSFFSAVLGGCNNISSGCYSTVIGGLNNIACSNLSANLNIIGSGQNNVVRSGSYNFIGNGQSNRADGGHNFIGSGFNNCINESQCSAIVGGDSNLVRGTNAFIGAGLCNKACAACSTIAGGSTNTTIFTSCYSFIGGGFSNIATGSYSFIGGGESNTVSGYFGRSVVVGGQCNLVTGSYSFIGGGACNTVHANYAGAFGCGLTNNVACSFMANQLIATNLATAGCAVCTDANGMLVTYTAGTYVPYTGATGDVTLGSYNLTAQNVILDSGLAALTADLLNSYGALKLTRGANGYFIPSVLAVDRTWTLPNATGTVALTSDIPSLAGYTPTAYLSAYHTASLNVITANAPATMSFSTTDFSYGGITISGSFSDKIKIANGGIYNIQFSAQTSKTTGTSANMNIWLAKNDSEVPSSNTGVTLAGGANDVAIPAWNFFVSASAGDYYQLMFAADQTNTLLQYLPSGSAAAAGPAIPSVILTVNRVG